MNTESANSTVSTNPRIGLIAGWGRFPIVIAQKLREQGYEVFCLGVKGHADPVLKEICHDFRPIGLAKLGAAVRYFQRNNVRIATMAGKIHKVLLFKKFYILRHLPDWYGVKTFYPLIIAKTRDRKDDTMLGTIVNAFARFGIRFAPATDFMPELLIRDGQICGEPLSLAIRKDIEFGWNLASEMGRLDVGQSVAVKGQAVLAVEAVEGTDECIRRAGRLCPAGGFTVIKVAKPQQDMRFDVPTIGLGTLETMAEAGASTLAVEAGKTIVLDEAELRSAAQKHGIRIVAVRSENELKAYVA